MPEPKHLQGVPRSELVRRIIEFEALQQENPVEFGLDADPISQVWRCPECRALLGVCGECGGLADFPDADRVQCDCGTTVCSACCEAVDGESYCRSCAQEHRERNEKENK